MSLALCQNCNLFFTRGWGHYWSFDNNTGKTKELGMGPPLWCTINAHQYGGPTSLQEEKRFCCQLEQFSLLQCFSNGFQL